MSLSIPFLLDGASAAAAGTYPPPSPPGEPGPTSPAPDATPPPAPPPQPDRGLPVTGGDLAGLAATGVGAVAVGFGLNQAAGRRRYQEPGPDAAAPSGPPDPDHDPHPPEGRSVSMHEPQFRMSPEALESADLLEGIEGPARERLAAVLHSAATSYRATLDELESVRGATGAGTDRFAELGEHVAWVLRASHDAAEEERRKVREELDEQRSSAEAELARRRGEVDELERRAAERLRLADEEAAARVAASREEAERVATSLRSDAEAQLSSLLQVQESLRVQLVEASDELRRSLDTLGAATATPAGEASHADQDEAGYLGS
jgi:hypothetical protein